MKFIKLEDGMELTILPLPKYTNQFYYEYRGFYKNGYFYSDNSDLHNIILSTIFKNKQLDITVFLRYLVVGLLNDQLVLTNIGRKIHDKIDQSLPIIDDNFRFKKLNVVITEVNSSIGKLPNFDNCYFTDDYYPIKYKDLNDYIGSLTENEMNCVENFINSHSLTNKYNIDILDKIFINNKLGDIKSLVRSYKLGKIKSRCLI